MLAAWYLPSTAESSLDSVPGAAAGSAVSGASTNPRSEFEDVAALVGGRSSWEEEAAASGLVSPSTLLLQAVVDLGAQARAQSGKRGRRSQHGERACKRLLAKVLGVGVPSTQ